MKPIYSLFILVAMIIVACHGGENKADNSSHEISHDTDSKMTAPSAPDTAARSGQARSIEINSTDPNEILSKIDEHLTSTASFTTAPAGGFTDGIVTVNNTLKDASFQKALVEVAIRKADNTTVRTDYYTVVNIDAGMSKQVKIPNNNQGSSILTRIVKVKSNELTKGEWVLVGLKPVID